jgi:hypothetical protein
MRLLLIHSFLLLLISSQSFATFPDFPSDDKIKQTLRSYLKGQGDVTKRSFKRLGNRTIQLESFISLEGDFDLACAIFSDLDHYDWAMKNINVRPDGTKYLIQILQMSVDSHIPDTLVTFTFALDMPIFHYKGKRQFKVKVTKTLDSLTLNADTMGSETGIINRSQAILKIFPAEGARGRLWIYINGRMEIGTWLLYEALPDKLMNGSQTATRFQTLIENYQNEEDRRRSLLIKSNPDPKEKKVPSGAGEDSNPQKPAAENPGPQ